MMKNTRWHYLRRVGSALLFLIALAWLLPAGGEADTGSATYVVIGTAGIQKENVTKAREQAIANSLVSAVGLVAADMMPLEMLVSNYETINTNLLSQTTRYIQDYKVLTEATTDSIYRAVVQVTVASRLVKSKLSRSGLLVKQTKKPRVMFFLAEQAIYDSAHQYWWGRGMSFLQPTSEVAIANEMKNKGIAVLSHGPTVQKRAFEVVNDMPEINRDEAIQFGADLNADFVILGQAMAENAPNTMGSGLRSFKGEITARAYRVSSGDEVVSLTRTAVTANMDEAIGGREALANAGNLVAEELSLKIVSAWNEESEQKSIINIYMRGTGNLANFIQFRRMLGGISGVKEVYVKELQGGTATLGVDYGGNSDALAKAVMLHTFDTFGIDIYEVTPDQLSIDLISQKPVNQR